MNSRRSPLMGKKRGGVNNFQSPRPYSMYVGSQYLKVSDSLSLSSNSSSGSDYNSSMTSTKTSKSKRNSSAESGGGACAAGAFDSLVCSIHSVDINSNNTSLDGVTSPPYEKSKKKSNSPKRKEVPPAGPSARTWMLPRNVKKLATGGLVFGTHIGKSGMCYVAVVTGNGDRVVQMYDRNGVMVKFFHTRATKAGKPFEPYQMCEMPGGEIAIACGTTVTIWSREGKLLNEHGKNMFKCAKSIAVRSTGEIFVTDTDNDAVKFISPNGQQINRLSADFSCPVGVAVDSEDNVIVVDWKDRIWIFDDENQLTRSFGSKGMNDGQIDLPYGVCVDFENNLVVTDMWNNRVSLYRQDGQFIRHLVPGPTQAIRLPSSVSVSRSENSGEYRMAVTTYNGFSAYLFAY